MPTATSFSTRGKPGSGFPGCTEHVDVSDYHLTAPMTLEQIGNLFWNSSKVLGTATLINNPDTNIDLEDSPELPEPQTRICGGTTLSTAELGDPETYWFANVSISTNWNVIKMYDGPVTNEANFVGYGINQPLGQFFALAGAYNDGGQGRVGISRFLVSYCQYDPGGTYGFFSEEGLWFQNYSILGNADCTATNTTLDGYPFVALNWDSFVGANGSASAEITGIEFYTYA